MEKVCYRSLLVFPVLENQQLGDYDPIVWALKEKSLQPNYKQGVHLTKDF